MIDRPLNRLAAFAAGHPWLVLALTVLATLAAAAQFPGITIDTDPKHMLPGTSPGRQYNDQVEREFVLHADVIALGIVSDNGIINRKTLSRIAELTREIQKLPGVISRDVVSFSTIDNVTGERGGLTFLIRGNTLRCYIFQLTALVTGLLLILPQGLTPLFTNWILLAKFLLLLILMGLLSVVHFSLQPRIDNRSRIPYGWV